MSKTDLYLNDEQYWGLLEKIEETVNRPNFRPQGHDSERIGAKETTTNCGMCNDGFTTKDTALFPNDFPNRNDMKYRGPQHVCPFDRRLLARKTTDKHLGSGCFYHCRIFSPQGKRLTPEEARQLVAKTKEVVKPKLKLKKKVEASK